MRKSAFETAAPWVPTSGDLSVLTAAAKECKGCDLYAQATQTVFGEGRENAQAVLIGEQPGDREDVEGRPFVGPAGRLLDKALEEAGIDRGAVYVTNAVKHFKNEPRGKRRIHKKPNSAEIEACRPWLDAELAAVDPDVIVCLGATASQALLGKDFPLLRERGTVKERGHWRVVATVHPSSLLRIPEADRRHEEYERFVDDLRVAARLIGEHKKA
jgi:DNA polymerase